VALCRGLLCGRLRLVALAETTRQVHQGFLQGGGVLWRDRGRKPRAAISTASTPRNSSLPMQAMRHGMRLVGGSRMSLVTPSGRSSVVCGQRPPGEAGYLNGTAFLLGLAFCQATQAICSIG